MTRPMTVEALPVQAHHKSRGDAQLWLAPRRTGNGAVPVLRYTDTATGHCIAVQLSDAEIVGIHEAAFSILAASPATGEDWLDQAAEAVATQCNSAS